MLSLFANFGMHRDSRGRSRERGLTFIQPALELIWYVGLSESLTQLGPSFARGIIAVVSDCMTAGVRLGARGESCMQIDRLPSQR